MRIARVRRWTWGVADQALSSLVNLLAGIAVARAGTTGEFGAFALALTVYWLALGANRALSSDPFIVRQRDQSAGASHELRAAAGTAVGLGCLASLGCLCLGVLADGPLRTSLLALGPLLPLLLLQDFARSASFATRRPAVAFMTDAVWLLGYGLVWAVLSATGTTSLATLTLAWGLAAGAAAGCGLICLGFLPRVQSAPRWLREHRDIAPSFLLEYVALTLSVQLSLVVVGAIGGIGEVGAMRGAQLLFGPWQVLLMGTGLFALPEAMRVLGERGPLGLMRFSGVVGGGLVAASIGWGIVLSLLPESLGMQILGASWPGAGELIPLTALSLATTSAIAGASLGLRALAAVRRSVPARLGTSAAILASASAGAWLDGARGALAGIATAGAVASGIWWWQLRLACLAHREPGSSSLPVASVLGRTR